MRTKLYPALLVLVVATLAALPLSAQPVCPGTYPPCSDCSCTSACHARCCADSGEVNVCANFVCRAFCDASVAVAGAPAAAPTAASSSCSVESAGVGAFLAGLSETALATAR